MLAKERSKDVALRAIIARERLKKYGGPKLRRAAFGGARLVSAPIRRKVQTRLTEFRIQQATRELAVKRKESELARLESQLRETKAQIARLRA